MKFILVFVVLTSAAFATEVSTDCGAMNGSREKIVKDGGAKKSKGSTRVSGQ